MFLSFQSFVRFSFKSLRASIIQKQEVMDKLTYVGYERYLCLVHLPLQFQPVLIG